MRWTFDIEAAQEQVVTSTTTLTSEAPERAFVLCVSGTGADGQPVGATGGARWSDGLGAFYTYLGGENGRTYEREFTFEAPLTSVSFELLHWPGRTAAVEDDVVAHVLRLAAWDRNTSVADAAVLVLPRPAGAV